MKYKNITHICSVEKCDTDCNLCPHGEPYGSDKCEYASCVDYCRHGVKRGNGEWCEACAEDERQEDMIAEDYREATGYPFI